MIRIRGTFTPAANGLTTVDYWLELRPSLVWAWLVAMPLGTAVVIAGFVAAHIPLLWLWPFPAAAAFVIAATAYLSRRQAERLAAFVRRELEA